MSADPRNSKNPTDKMSELKVLQELANVRAPNSGQHNFTEGSIALGKVGNKKAGRLRFRISSGAIFSPSKQQEARPAETLSKGEAANTSHDENPLVDPEKDIPGKAPDKSDEDSKTGSNPHAEDPDGPPEELDIYSNENSSGSDKKAAVFKIFKNLAQQFDALQDLFGDDCGNDSSSFNRTSNRLTLENISTSKGNFTRVRFIRRKVTEKEKKPKARSIEQLMEVEDPDY
uniref:UvrABC system protein C n=1 Tax=Lygus hesperus TaxID=30085 RepID=A0A0A9WVC4_LYGHE